MVQARTEADPERIGDYQVVGRLGAGGQGTVYLGVSPAGLLSAVKVLQAGWASEDKARRRLAREADAARRVAPFCTAAVREAHVDGPLPYIVTEYVPGPSLADHVARCGPLAGGELHAVAVATMTALLAIHRARVVHRDLKPSNVLLARTGVKVIDFGIAQAEAVPATLIDAVVDAPAYLAPEQVNGDETGPAADVFAWAGTIAFAATGRPPFGTGSLPAVLLRVTTADPDLSGVPEALAGLLSRCLAKDPVRRPDARTVLEELLGVVGEPGTGPVALLTRGATVASTTIRGLEVPIRQTGTSDRLRSVLSRTASPRPGSAEAASPRPGSAVPTSLGGSPPRRTAVTTPGGRPYRPPYQAVRERIRRQIRAAQGMLGVGALGTVIGVPGGVWLVSVKQHGIASIAFGAGPLLTVIAARWIGQMESTPRADAGIEVPARATLIRVTELENSHHGRRMLRFEGWVRLDGGPPRQVVVEGAPPLNVLEQVRGMETVPVLVDPRDPARPTLDWDRLQTEVTSPASPGSESAF